MTTYTIVIPGKLTPWERAGARNGVKYTPPRMAAMQAHIKASAILDAGQILLNGPIGMQIEIFLPVPESWSRKKKEAAIVGEVRPTGRPDVDNYCKQILDAFNGIIFNDDAQVVDLRVSKRYGIPETIVSVREAVPA